jgi:hypothetical protein
MAQRSRDWDALGRVALARFIRDKGAVIWPAEVIAYLSETTWVRDNVDSSLRWGAVIQPHVLGRARDALVAAGAIRADSAVLNQHQVVAYIDNAENRPQTELIRLAATKRRAYRRYLAWAGTARLCGGIAERAVLASLISLRGINLFVPAQKPGDVRELLGQPIPGGPLDSKGTWIRNLDDPADGAQPFAVEVKNLRGWIYPWHAEVWDVLSKLGHFPRVVPLLVGRKIAPPTFGLFKGIGAVGREYRTHLFSAEIDRIQFADVTRFLGLTDAVQLESPDTPLKTLTDFFDTDAYAATTTGEPFMARSGSLWQIAAPICTRYMHLRRDDLPEPDRMISFRQAVAEFREAGLQIGPVPVVEEEAQPDSGTQKPSN